MRSIERWCNRLAKWFTAPNASMLAASLLALGVVSTHRYDVLVAACMMAALAAASRGGAVKAGLWLGLGAAANNPAWQAIIPELVPRAELPGAIALGSIGFNIARAAGPALGGLIVATAGPGWTFILNAVSFLGVMAVLYRWKRPAEETVLPGERTRVHARLAAARAAATTVLRVILFVDLSPLGCGGEQLLH